ncbi:MAG: cell division protein FtsZ [Clostridiales Family XIII bacterium]|jgi:cell division protein FtsZ|nr:cell division protein FtsZ [Clostridiales Family XIII bacterium]
MLHDGILLEKKDTNTANIIVVGVGGGGGNAVNRMVECDLTGVDYIAINTDAQDLEYSNAELKIQIGSKLTGGLGAGGKPEIGLESAEENLQDIENAIKGADLLFITAGMGGGTGTGAAPVVAKLAKEKGILTVGVVTKPFSFENKKKKQHADKGIEYLKKYVDSLVLVPNDKLLLLAGDQTSVEDSFNTANEVLKDGIQGITDIIVRPGLINVDFADVRSVMSQRGVAHMGIGRGSGADRVQQAVDQAVNSPLLETSIAGAKALLLNIAGGSSLGMLEASSASDMISQEVDDDADVYIGITIDETLGDEITLTIIATGFEDADGISDADLVLPERMQSGSDYDKAFGLGPAPSNQSEISEFAPAEGTETDSSYGEYEPANGAQQESILSETEEGEGNDFIIPGFLKKED